MTAEHQPGEPLSRAPAGLQVVPTEAGLAISGEADLSTWSALSDALDKAVDGMVAGEDVVLDLSGLSFIDGHGIQLIVRAARRLSPSSRLVLHRAPQMLLRIAEILRVGQEPGLIIRGRGDGPS